MSQERARIYRVGIKNFPQRLKDKNFPLSLRSPLGEPVVQIPLGLEVAPISPFVYGIKARLLLISLFLFVSRLSQWDSHCAKQVGVQSRKQNVQKC